MQNNKINRFFWMIPCFILGVSSVFFASCEDACYRHVGYYRDW